MAKNRLELAQERARLTERIAAQRSVLARELAPLQRVSQAGTTVTGLVSEVLAYIRQHPLALATVLGSALLLRPRSVLRWVKRGMFLWRGWRTLQRWQPGIWLGLLRRFL
ncbi:YqjK family protein [Rhodoferax sp.]|uniref:YqjK family protein n=1 Tax=Rhodoferax sp. TaxID=50421 RepID=UPI00374D6CE9